MMRQDQFVLVWTFAVVACSLTVRAGLNVIPQPKEVVEEPGCFLAPEDIFEKLPAEWRRAGRFARSPKRGSPIRIPPSPPGGLSPA